MRARQERAKQATAAASSASPEAKVRLTKLAGTAPCDSLPQPVLSSCS
eukprot:COSAG01_NODE_12016_length_1816_cov_2.455446_1_plen_47_part_10